MSKQKVSHALRTRSLASRASLTALIAKAARRRKHLAKADLRAARKSLKRVKKVAKRARKEARIIRKKLGSNHHNGALA